MAAGTPRPGRSPTTGIKLLFWTWFGAANGALSTVLIDPTGKGYNRAIPFLALVALSLLIAMVLGFKTLFRRKVIPKRTFCLGLLPIVIIIGVMLTVINHLLNGVLFMDVFDQFLDAALTDKTG